MNVVYDYVFRPYKENENVIKLLLSFVRSIDDFNVNVTKDTVQCVWCKHACTRAKRKSLFMMDPLCRCECVCFMNT